MPVQTEVILESISDGVFTVDPSWRITYFNRAAEEITGVPRKEALGRFCWDVFRSNMCEEGCALRETLKTGKPIIGKTGYIINAAGERIPVSISTAVLNDEHGEIVGGAETFRDLSEIESLRTQLTGKLSIGNIVSRSPLMQKVFEVLPPIAQSQSTVLILGETGTGKSLIARTIHELSPRKDKPFVIVNCGALPETLLESELFGYRAGAFTGATKNKPGRFALADGGTIFLDEIAEMSPAMQAKLLRVLQDRTYEPLGATKPEKVDVRIITATNKDLADLVRNGLFREDLYYRINVVRIELPPLRRRKEDIPLLVDEFIKKFNRIEKKSIKSITSEALSMLMGYDWPGNIRELENVIERACVLCNGDMIDTSQLPPEITTKSQIGRKSTKLKLASRTIEATMIEEALQRHNYNRQAAAKALGIHRSTLFRKIKNFGIQIRPSK
ncbi:MAG: sigma 54-interacting transcriptional regulator [Thermodesulforhabdaceae bacterium]